MAVRKRTIIALSHLVLTCDQGLYVKLLDYLLQELSDPAAAAAANGNNSSAAGVQNTRTNIQAVGAICKQAGHRFGDHVEKVVPLVLGYAEKDDDEMREHCLQACESESSDS